MAMETKLFMHTRIIFDQWAFVVAILLTWGFHAVCHAQTTEHLIEITNKAFQDTNKNYPGLSREEKFVRAFDDSFKGIGAEKRTIALAHSLYDIDATSPKWEMSAMITMGTIDLLAADPGFIDDWSYLRKMLDTEKDPRKYYLLSRIASMAKSPDNDFVAERTHMLFADGRVAKEEGEYTKAYAHDVSSYAYSAIIANLQQLGAEFAHPPTNLPHEEQAVILAKWLKENWPGCENLEIPDNAVNEKDPADNTSMDTRERPRKPPATEPPQEVAEVGILRYLLVGVTALLALAGAWFGLRRIKLGA